MRIEDASPESVQGMVDFIYTGTIPTNISDMVEDILHLADKYERCLVDGLTVDSAITTIIRADM